MITLTETEFCMFTSYLSIMYRAFIAGQIKIADYYKLKLVNFLKEKCDLDEEQAYIFIENTALMASNHENKL